MKWFNRQRRAMKKTGEEGSALLFVTIALLVLLAFAAWATETARVWQAKTQLQAAADASSLAGVGSLLTNDFTTVDEAAARAAATSYGPLHKALDTPVAIANADVDVGSWSYATRTFTPLPGSSDPDLVRAVRVRTRRDDNVNGPVQTILGRAVGVDSISVNTEAVALWGFAGSGGPGVADLPITIDCCAISGDTPGSACTQHYCDTIASEIPNPCPLESGEMTTCLEFYATPEQNACWTVFDPESPSVAVPDMRDIVEDGNPHEIGGEPVYIDNGTKTPVIRDIRDRFEGLGEFAPDPAGTDTDGDGVVDSWVVVLPVIECQNPGDHCASGTPAVIKSFICFDIHEVIPTPDGIIKGDFLCPTDPRCDNEGLGPGGDIPGTISAAYPVVVD
jgi:Flp pilus assembly protein TadG